MRRWLVTRDTGTDQEVSAHTIRFDCGTVVFTTWDDHAVYEKHVIAFAPGTWREVELLSE